MSKEQASLGVGGGKSASASSASGENESSKGHLRLTKQENAYFE